MYNFISNVLVTYIIYENENLINSVVSTDYEILKNICSTYYNDISSCSKAIAKFDVIEIGCGKF